MSLLLLALACGPKVPPPGSTELTREPSTARSDDASLDAPLPPGTALPLEQRGQAAALAAFLEGEALLGRIQKLDAPRNPAESQARAVEGTALAEEAIGAFARAAELDPTLRAYTAARTGDAWRMAGALTREVQPPMHVPPAGEQAFRAEQAIIASELDARALLAYQLVLADRLVDPRWKAHARWAIAQLPGA